jgi:glycosyltransferase involved in cell wall biosynthesis
MIRPNFPETPSISVVITAHNEAARIGACLRSLAAQTGVAASDVEIILVDDRSTDGTADIARACRLPNLVLLTTGAADGRRLTTRQMAIDKGIRAARGDIIALFDADAILEPDLLARLTYPLKADRADIVAGFAAFRSKTGAIGAWQTVDAAFYLGVCRCLAWLHIDAGVLFGNCAFRRRLYVEAGGFEAIGFALTEDLAFARAQRRHGARFHFLMDATVEVGAADSWNGLVERARRVGSGAFGPLQAVIGLWMAALPALLVAAILSGSIEAAAALTVRYVIGAMFVGYHLVAARQIRFLPRALVYEPLAIVIGVMVIARRARDQRVVWGARIYGA